MNKIDANNNILSTMTRTSILALISMIFSILVPIAFILVDIYTNFICVMLSYSVFSKQYSTCCGWIDAKFKVFLFNTASKVHKAMKVSISDANEANGQGER